MQHWYSKNSMNKILIDRKKLRKIESIINYSFKNKDLIIKAICHSSYNQKYNYEQLEYLGDSLINFYSTLHIYKNNKLNNPGSLSIKRTQLINNDLLSSITIHLGLDKYILVGKKVSINKKITSDIFESITAAIYLDSDIETLFIFLELNLINKIKYFSKKIDYKGKFIEYIQNTSLSQYNFNTKYNNEKKKFITLIDINGYKIEGCGKNKKMAEQEAAKIAIKYIKNKS